MPLFLFIFGLFLLFFLNKELRKILLASLISFFILFQFIIYSGPQMKSAYRSFYENVYQTYSGLINPKKSEKVMEKEEVRKKEEYSFPFYPESIFSYSNSTHFRLFLTAIDTWKKNIILGNGIKSFRIDCSKLIEVEYNLDETLHKFKKNRLCSNHPHNYYFEVLTDTGIVGFFILSILMLSFIFFILKNLKIFKKNNIENFILLGSTISLVLEIMPFKVSGSIFTTNNTTYIILLLAIILSYRKLPS